jgi:2-oxoacid:acceptor oxidoreductase delta subunit (pyruvate/2-ketoisovalerate family)
MRELKDWSELSVGGAIAPGTVEQPHTGSWRTGLRPSVDRSRCVNCLLCWLYCPDSAVQLDGTVFTGIDLDFCKGCELCAEICPVDAIAMVDDVT